MKQTFRGILLVPFTLLLHGCGTGPAEELVIGEVCCPFDQLQVQLPDTVGIGAAFSVTLETYGNSCIRKGHVEVTEEEGAVVLTPYDYRNLEAQACDDILLTFEHEATVSLEAAGENSILIRGRGSAGSIETYPRTVWVRE